ALLLTHPISAPPPYLRPSALTFVSASPTQVPYTSASGVWTLRSFPTRRPSNLSIQASVASPSPQTNTASVSHADQSDPNTGNNAARATETPRQADLGLTKTVSNPKPNVGDTLTFTVTLSALRAAPTTNVTRIHL